MSSGPSLLDFLPQHPPFDALAPGELRAAVAAAHLQTYEVGDLVVDAFERPTVEVFVVIRGEVELWNDAERLTAAADERLGPGGVFGFSAMLTEQSVGPRVIAVTRTTVARIPAAAWPGVLLPRGAQFLAEHVTAGSRLRAGVPTYSLVDDLIVQPPLAVEQGTSLGEVARLMTERDVTYAAVRLPDGRDCGLITDEVLRRRVIVEGLSPRTSAAQVMQVPAPTTMLGESAAEALILMLDERAEYLLVTDRLARLRGVIRPQDFVVSPTTAGVALHEQIRRAATIDDLVTRAQRLPGMLGDALWRGLAAGKVIAVNSAVVDTIVRRSLELIFREHPDLSPDRFTWLSLGSNGRREAVLSSDVDSAVAFDDNLDETQLAGYRTAFGQVEAVLVRAGLRIDEHGATARRAPFSRRNADWRAAAEQWLAAPDENEGAIMASLLVDGRPIHGDPGLPAARRVFRALREHPGTMRLLLQESLSQRARLRSMRDALTRGRDAVDVKTHALLPIVNIARLAALSVSSAELGTTERLRAASGSQMLPSESAATLVEVFDVLQRLRLR